MALKDFIPNNKSTQDFVPIKEIKNGVVILKDGSLRAVVMVSSLNFGLKSDDEKVAIISAFQNFLNSIDFTIQISIQSRRLNIEPYLQTLRDRMAEQTNELLKVQIREYIEFIRFYTDHQNVMTKTFFVVVSYEPALIAGGERGFLSKIFNSQKANSKSAIINEFDQNVAQLNQRTNVIKSGLSRMGLVSAVLGTEELIELYFKLFNPGENDAPASSNNGSTAEAK